MKNKKAKKANLERYRPALLYVGLGVACSMALVAFEWTSSDEKAHYAEIPQDEDMNVIYEIEDQDEPVKEEEPKPEPIVNNAPAAPSQPTQPTPPTPPVITNPTQTTTGQETPGLPPIGPPPPITGGKKPPKIGGTIDWFKVTIKPEFPGDLYEWLGKNIKYPKIAREMGVTGKTAIEFTVGEDGAVRDAKIKNKPGNRVGGGCDEEALRVVQMMPNWIPGEHMGHKVAVRYILPIDFQLDTNK